MKLFYMTGAGSLASHVALEWAGADYEAVALRRSELQAPAFLGINPMGTVPVLADGDLRLTESIAILAFIADRHPRARLWGGDGSGARAQTLQWLAFLNAEVHKAYGPVFYPERHGFGLVPDTLVADAGRERVRELLQRYLEGEGFAVKAVGDGTQLRQALDRGHFDLIVLDLMLPGESGLELCRRLRGQGDTTPVVMLTAKGDEIDRIIGLEIGADDYLPKPVNPRELLARIRSVLRRTQAVPGAPQAEGGIVAFGPWRLDLGNRQLSRQGRVVKLTSGEFAVLAVLVRHPRQTLSRDRLMSLARGREHEAFERSMDVTIARLRKLLEDDARNPTIVQTVWGAGYVFVPPEEVA